MVLEGFPARTKVVLVKKESKQVRKKGGHVGLPGTSLCFKHFPLIGMKIENHTIHKCTAMLLFFTAVFEPAQFGNV